MGDDQMCANDDCEELVQQARIALGYKTCIYCGSPKKQFTVAVAYNKGCYQVISPEMVKFIGK